MTAHPPASVPTGPGEPPPIPSGLIEIARRAALVGGLLAAIWFACWPAPALVRVRLADFAADPPGRWRWSEDARPLEERAAAEVADRLAPVSGAGWADVARAAAAVARGESPPEPHAFRADTDSATGGLWFRPDEAPVSDLAGEIGDTHPFFYVPIHGEKTRFLGVTWLRPHWASGAPAALLHPHRTTGLLLLAAAIAVYALLPRPRFLPGDVHYSRFRGTILPDILGMLLTGVFFALPVLVVADNAAGGDWTGEGWIVLWMVGWGMACFGLAIHAFAARFAVFRLRLLPDRIVRTTLTGDDEMRIADIERVRLRPRRPSKAIVVAGALVSLANWRALGPTLTYASRGDLVLEILPRGGGTPFRLDPVYCVNTETMLAALERAGVPFEDATEE